jgi:hypothetical protein
VPPNIPGDRLILNIDPESRTLTNKKGTSWHQPALIEIPEPGFVPHDQNRASPNRSVVTTPPETFGKLRQNAWSVLSAPQLEPTLDFFL